MNFPHIYVFMNKISDLSERTALQLPNSITEIRKHVNMLIIDDNDFSPEPYLISMGTKCIIKAILIGLKTSSHMILFFVIFLVSERSLDIPRKEHL